MLIKIGRSKVGRITPILFMTVITHVDCLCPGWKEQQPKSFPHLSLIPQMKTYCWDILELSWRSLKLQTLIKGSWDSVVFPSRWWIENLSLVEFKGFIFFPLVCFARKKCFPGTTKSIWNWFTSFVAIVAHLYWIWLCFS